jgi:hypothetical protein
MKTSLGVAMPEKQSPIHGGAPIVDIDDIVIDPELLNRKCGRGRAWAIMHSEGAPTPLTGGRKGSKCLWSRAEVLAFLHGISRTGQWPTLETEDA